jgi:CspA family cold shock protein
MNEEAREVKYGTVVWFNAGRGYGYIAPEDGGKDYFVHWSNIDSEPNKFKTLIAGQKVSFVVGANNKGPQAEQVVVLETPELSEE